MSEVGMVKKQLRAFIVVFMTIGSSHATSGMRQLELQTASNWWFNLPSSPLTFAISPSKRDLMLVNRSSTLITSYRLGCVIEVEGRTRVVCKMAKVRMELKPGEALMNSITVYSREKERCDKKRAKLAVVETQFTDGSSWKAN
jgi:hypothetical protein